MQELIFHEDNHIYQLNGEVLPSVSELCAPLHKSVYADVPKWQLEQAAERGTAVHNATVSLDATGQAQCEEEHLPYVLAYKKFRDEHAVLWGFTEHAMHHPELHYAGTPDRYGMVDGKWTLVDIKTTYTVYKPLCRAQLNLYRLMLLAKGYVVDRMSILHLKKDATYKLVPMEEDEPLAMALITIYNALRTRRKKGATKCLKK